MFLQFSFSLSQGHIMYSPSCGRRAGRPRPWLPTRPTQEFGLSSFVLLSKVCRVNTSTASRVLQFRLTITAVRSPRINPRSTLTPAFRHLGNHLEIRAAARDLAAQRSLIYGLYLGSWANSVGVQSFRRLRWPHPR